MSYPQSTRDQFLSLRADGLSYAQCAKQLNVSRHTLILWAKEMKPDLDALRSVRTEELLEQVQLRVDQRIILLAGFYHKVCQTIENTSLLSRGIAPLFNILLKLNAALDKYEVDPASLKLTARLAGRAEPSTAETEPPPEIVHEKTEPPLTSEPEAPIAPPQPLINSELATPIPEPEKTEPKLNHPEFSLSIQNPKSVAAVRPGTRKTQ
jgi:hypothetical protein